MSDWKDKHLKFKSVYKWFWIWEDDLYEKWLNKMSIQGWHMIGVDYYPGIRFHFIKGEPKNYTYKLDYKPLKNEDMGEYLDLYSYAGWEYIGKDIAWKYFRKEAVAGEADDIYSDNESKIQHYKRIIKLVLAIGLYNLFAASYNLILYFIHGESVSISASILCFACVLLMAFGINKLYRRVKELSNIV